MDQQHYQVRVADREYWREQIKCQYACPVHTDARGYVRAIAAGEYERAYLIACVPNPLASICGAPCEAACRRGSIDQPISIRALICLVPGAPHLPRVWPFGFVASPAEGRPAGQEAAAPICQPAQESGASDQEYNRVLEAKKIGKYPAAGGHTAHARA